MVLLEKLRVVHGLTIFFLIPFSINTGREDAAAHGRDEGHGQELV
jgi:hypothetical protein